MQLANQAVGNLTEDVNFLTNKVKKKKQHK